MIRRASPFLLLAAIGCGQDPEAPAELQSVVVRSLEFAREDPKGVSRGLDLDGFVSAENDDRSCDKVDFVDPAGKPGIDNELGRIMPLVDLAGENALQGLIQGAINEGQLLVVFEVEKSANGMKVVVRRGMDSPILGTDGRILAGQTLALHPEDPFLGETTAREDDTGMLITEPFNLRLPVIVFSYLYVVEMPKAIVHFRIDENGDVDGGLIAGGIPVTQLIAVLTQASVFGGDFEGLFGEPLANSADLDRDPTGKCLSTSVAVGFDATSAFTF
jgi:hypothetical protein